jgi:hypothetical protein
MGAGTGRRETGLKIDVRRGAELLSNLRVGADLTEGIGNMAKQSPAQKDTVERVMHEFKHGELKANGGRKVRNPKQAIAIALRESGSSNQESPKANRENLKKTKAKERKDETGQAATEGKKSTRASAKSTQARKPAAKSRAASGNGKTRAELYEAAKKRDIPGRSKMNKDELARALGA